MMKTKAVMIILLLSPAPPPIPETQLPSNSTEERLAVSYSMTAQEFSLNEPVSLALVIENDSPAPIQLDLGGDRKENFRFAVTGPDGVRVSLRARRTGGLQRVGLIKIQSGNQYKQTLLLNEWIDFSLIGTYEIEADLFPFGQSEHETPRGDPFNFRTRVTIGPRNPTKLEAVCASLAREAENANSYESAAEAALALSYVHDQVSVPYLQRVLRTRPLTDRLVIEGLEKIANENAVEVLISALATSEPPETARLARAALHRIEDKISDAPTRERIRKALESPELQNP